MSVPETEVAEKEPAKRVATPESARLQSTREVSEQAAHYLVSDANSAQDFRRLIDQAAPQSPQYQLAEKLLGKDMKGVLTPGKDGAPEQPNYVRQYFAHQSNGDANGAKADLKALSDAADKGSPQARRQLQAVQLIDAVSRVQSGVTSNNMTEAQQGLVDLARLERSVSTAGFILDRFPDSGNGRSNLREAQVKWARIAAAGGDAAVLQATQPAQEKFKAAGSDDPARRTTALIDLTLANQTLSPLGRQAFYPNYQTFQALDMVANLTQSLGKANGDGRAAGQPDLQGVASALDFGLKLSRSGNRPAKEWLAQIGVHSENDVNPLVNGLAAGGKDEAARLSKSLDRMTKPESEVFADAATTLFSRKGNEFINREDLEQIQKTLSKAFKINGWQGVEAAVKEANEKLKGTDFTMAATQAPFAPDTVRLTVENKENGSVRTTSFPLTEKARDAGNDTQLARGKEEIRAFPDGAFVADNKNGLPTRTLDASGKARAFMWDGKDLIAMKDTDGSEWLKANKEGDQWRNPKTGEVRHGKIEVANDGTYTVTKADHSSTSFKIDGSEIRRNEQGFVTSTTDKFGRESQYDNFDKSGKPQWIKESTGTVWKRTDDKDGTPHWASSKNDKWDGTVTLDHATGVRTEVGPRGEWSRVRGTDGIDKIVDKGTVTYQQDNVNRSTLIKDAQNRPAELRNEFGSHKFERDEKGEVKAVQGPNAQLKRLDENTWAITQNGKTENVKGQFVQGPDGSYGIVGANKSVFEVKSDGGIVATNPDGKITQTTAPNGKGFRLEWDAKGISQLTDRNGDAYGRQQEGSFKTADGKKTLDGVPIVTADGTVALASKSGQTVYTTDGRVLTRDADGHKVRLESARGDVITYQRDAKGQDVPKEYERADHSKLTFDQVGNIVSTRDVLGRTRSIELKEGKVNAFHDDTGNYRRGPEAEKGKPQSWLRDGPPVTKHYLDVAIRPDGTFIKTDDVHSTNTAYRPDGKREVVTEVKRTPDGKPVYAYRLENDKGSILEETPAGATKPFKFEYLPNSRILNSVKIPQDGGGELTLARQPNGTWTGSDGNSYKPPQLNTRDGGLTVMRSDYTTTFYKASGDHVQVPGDRAEKLYEQFRKEMFDSTFYVSNSNMLEFMQNAATPEDLKVVNRMFADRKGRPLESYLYDSTYLSQDSRRDKAVAMFRHEDGPQNAAGEIHTIIGEIEKGGGASREDAESRLRQLLSGMSHKEILLAQEKYQRDYGTRKDLFDLLVMPKDRGGDYILSRPTKDVVEFNLRGRDNQDSYTQFQKMSTAVSAGDSRMFNEAAATTPDAVRDEWLRRGGSGRLQSEFEGHWYHGLTLGLTGNVTDSELNLVRSYAQWGEAGADALVKNNTSWLGDNEEAIKHSLDNMGDKQRAAYRLGQQMEKGTAPVPKNDEERRQQEESFKYYKSLDNALQAAAGVWFSPSSQVAELNDWRDRILVKGGGFASELAPHVGSIYDSDRKDILATMRGMTEEQWKQLKADPDSRKRVTEILSQFDPLTSYPASKMFKSMMDAGSYAEAKESGKASIFVNINDARNTFSRNDYQHVYDAILNMKESDRKSYATNEKFRASVDRAVDSAIGTEHGREAAHRMLQQIQDSGGRPPQWGLIEQMQAYTGNGKFPETQKLIRDLKTEIDKPGVKDKLLDANSDMRKQFDSLMEQAVPNPQWRKQIVDGLLSKSGTPPLDLELQIGRMHNDWSGMLRDIQSAPKSEKDRLATDAGAWGKAFGYLSQDKERFVRQMLSQEGEMRPEDKLRAYVLGLGVSKEEALDATRGLNDAKRGDAINSYIKKYNGNLIDDLRGEMDLESFRSARDNLIYGPRTAYDAQVRALNRFSDSADSVGAWVNRGFGWDGTPQGLDNMMFRFSGDLAKQGQDGKPTMSLDEARERYQGVVSAARLVDQSSAQMADIGSDIAIAAVAIGGSWATGGASLGLLAFTTAAGAGTKILAKRAFLGNNYDSHEMLADGLKGGFSGALNFVGGGEIAFGLGLGKAGAARAAEMVAAGAVRKEALAMTEAQIAKELERTVAHAIAANTSKVAPKVVNELVDKIAARGISEADRLALRTTVDQALKKGIEETAGSAMAGYARSVGLSGLAGAGGGGAGAFAGSLADADWKRNSFSGNVLDAAKSGLMNAPAGFAMGAGAHVGLQAGGHAFGAGRKAVSWAAGHTTDGVKWSYNKVSGMWQGEHVPNVDTGGAGKPVTVPESANIAKPPGAERVPDSAIAGGARAESVKPTGDGTADGAGQSGTAGDRQRVTPREEVYKPQIPQPTDAELEALNRKIPGLNKEAAEDFSQRMNKVREGWKEDLAPESARAKDLGDQVKVAQERFDSEIARRRADGANDAQIDLAQRTKGDPLNELNDARLKVIQEHADLTRHLDGVAKSRQVELQRAVDDFVSAQNAKGSNLPNVTVATADHMHAAGGYDWGEGVITVPREDLLAANGGKGLSKTIFHEAVHAEQDLLLVRNSIRETTAGGAPLNPENVKANYKAATGRELSSDFLNQVVEQSKGKPELSAADIARAQELGRSVTDSSPVAERSRELGDTARVIDSTLRKIEASPDGLAAERIFQRLTQPDGDALARRLFGDKPVPDAVMEQFKKWQALPTDLETGGKIGFKPEEANRALTDHLKTRLTEVNGEHKALIDKYVNSAIEKDARLEVQVREFGGGDSAKSAMPLANQLSSERAAIQQLEAVPNPKPEQIRELNYLRDKHAEAIKESARELKEIERRLEELEKKRDINKQALEAKELNDYKDGMERRKQLKIELHAERDAAIERLIKESPKPDSQGGVSGRQQGSGDSTQGVIFRQLNKEMDIRSSHLGGQTPRQAGYELVAIKANSAFDAIGGDYALINKRTGEFIPIDGTQRSKEYYPKLRQDNIIRSDPHDPNYTMDPRTGRRFEIGSTEYRDARIADIHYQFDQIMGRFRKEGSPLNVLETPISTKVPPDYGQTSHLGDRDRLAAIDAIKNPAQRKQELSAWRASAEAKGKQLDQMIQDMRDRASELRKSGDPRDARAASLLEDYARHSQRSARAYNDNLINRDIAPRERIADKATQPKDASTPGTDAKKGRAERFPGEDSTPAEAVEALKNAKTLDEFEMNAVDALNHATDPTVVEAVRTRLTDEIKDPNLLRDASKVAQIRDLAQAYGLSADIDTQLTSSLAGEIKNNKKLFSDQTQLADLKAKVATLKKAGVAFDEKFENALFDRVRVELVAKNKGALADMKDIADQIDSLKTQNAIRFFELNRSVFKGTIERQLSDTQLQGLGTAQEYRENIGGKLRTSDLNHALKEVGAYIDPKAVGASHVHSAGVFDKATGQPLLDYRDQSLLNGKPYQQIGVHIKGGEVDQNYQRRIWDSLIAQYLQGARQ